jgi:serine protease inhibitor
MDLFAVATTKFTLELYRQLRESDNNIFYSPISMMRTLAMLLLGAKANTEQQIKKVGLSFVLMTSLNLTLKHFVSVQVNDNTA